MRKSTTLKAIKQKEALLKELYKVRARKSFQQFVTYTYEGYEMEWFHKCVCAYLRCVVQGRH